MCVPINILITLFKSALLSHEMLCLKSRKHAWHDVRLYCTSRKIEYKFTNKIIIIINKNLLKIKKNDIFIKKFMNLIFNSRKMPIFALGNV